MESSTTETTFGEWVGHNLFFNDVIESDTREPIIVFSVPDYLLRLLHLEEGGNKFGFMAPQLQFWTALVTVRLLISIFDFSVGYAYFFPPHYSADIRALLSCIMLSIVLDIGYRIHLQFIHVLPSLSIHGTSQKTEKQPKRQTKCGTNHSLYCWIWNCNATMCNLPLLCTQVLWCQE